MSEGNNSAPESAKDLKGRVKEAAGNISGNQDLKREGKVEQAGEKVKAGVDSATHKVKELFGRD